MNIRIRKTQPPASTEELKNLELNLGIALPESYRGFLSEYNGATPESNIFTVSERDHGGISQFIPCSEILEEKNLVVDVFPNHVIPIAWSAGGNYVCIDLTDSSVLFWDHEEYDHLRHLASSLDEFLHMLTPFDISTVELKPEQVISVWIAPGFLESIRKNDVKNE